MCFLVTLKGISAAIPDKSVSNVSLVFNIRNMMILTASALELDKKLNDSVSKDTV